MRYLLALLIAGFVICGILLTAHQMKREVHERIRKSLIQARERGELPADIDLDQPEFTDKGMELSSSEMQLIGLLDLWYALRIVLIPLIIIGCLALAWFTAESRSSDGKAVETNHSP
ncbi:MAG: hypothetical protein WCJ09_15675 [Planctomycetota bacterium]